MKCYSVSQINGYVKGLIEDDILLNGFFAEGEISNFKAHTSGHYYFTLKDSASALGCVMFRECAAGIPFVPEDGMNAVIYGRLSVYEKTGQYRLYAETMEPMGKGSLYAAYEQLKRRLGGEGLFSPEHKKEIPQNPRCIAVITSPTGAAVRDVINVSRRRNRGVRLVVVPVSVQGAAAGAEIASAIAEVNEWGGADVIIVGRGGGSIEDLWAFNEERVARAIFASRTPVISAVGHETDFTIADFTADLRAATPSAAAEIATPDISEAANRLYSRSLYLNRAVKALLDENAGCLADARKRLGRAADRFVGGKRGSFEQKLDGLHKLSPLNVLKRGYCVAYGKDEKVLTSVRQVACGDSVTLAVRDGKISAEVVGRDYGEEYEAYL